MNNPNIWPNDRPVRCENKGCGWEGDEQDLDVVCTFPGRWFGDPPEPPEYEAFCPKCRRWEFIADIIEGEQSEQTEEG